jgi:O-antigen/teichoic acid export membrane protein
MDQRRSFLNAVKWGYSGDWGEKGISAVLFLLFAGILGPTDFGIVSIAVIYVGFFRMFLDQGLAAALIQRRDVEQGHLDAVFWTNLAFSVCLVLISLLFGREWAALYHTPKVAIVTWVLSLSIVLEALSIVQIAILRRHMNFRALSIRSNVSLLISGIVGSAMALLGFGVWSLVGFQLLRDFIGLMLLWRIGSWRPGFRFSWRHLNELLGFSVPHFVAQLAYFVDATAASMLLGTLFGPTAVGLYNLALRAVNTVISMSSASIHSASFSQFSRVQDNPVELRNSVLLSVRMSATMSMPALAGLAVISEPLLATIGAGWVPASDALKVMCVAGMTSAFTNFTSPLIQALGRPRQSAILEWGRTVAGVAVLVAAGLLFQNSLLQYQVLSIATARLFTTLFLVIPIFVYLLLDLSDVSLRDLLASTFPAILASIVVLLSVELFRYVGMFQESISVVALAMQVLIGTVAGVITLTCTDSTVRKFLGGVSQEIVSWFSTKSP